MPIPRRIHRAAACYAVTRAYRRRLLSWLDQAGARLARPPRVLPPAGEIRSVLFVRRQNFGDLMLLLPALDRARELFPQARIGLVLRPEFQPFFAQLARWDEVFTLADRGRRPLRQRYDLAIECHGDLRELWQARRLARWVIGYGIRGGHFLCDVEARYSRRASVIERHCRLVEIAANAQPIARPLPRLGPGAAARSGIILHPGCGTRSKRWSLESWRQLARRLMDEGHRLVFTGSAADRANCQAIAADLPPGSVQDQSGCTDWQKLAELVAGVRAVIAPDTGIIHLAQALATPTVALFGPNDPGTWGYNTARHRSLWARQPCSFCARAACSRVSRSDVSPCMSAITPAAVAGTLFQVLEERASARAASNTSAA